MEQIFSALSNVLAPKLNATKTVGVIIELRYQSRVNLVGFHAFLVEKADDKSPARLHLCLKNLNEHQFQKLFGPSLSMRKIEFDITYKILM
jgi:hypothetical protein